MSYRRITLVTNPDSCNLKCPLCFLNQRQKPLGLGVMDFALVEKTIRSFYSKDLKEIIPSTMGEPLLYPYFKNLLDLCSELSLKLNLTTNGTFPLGGVSYWAEPLLTHCSDIKISMMGLSASVNEHLMCGINQKEYLENIKFLVEEKKKLQKQEISVSTISLQVTVCKMNWKELPDILEFAEKTGIDRIKWNKAFFLSETRPSFKKEYGLDEEGSDFEEWKQMAFFIQKKAKIRVEGSFFDLEKREPSKELKCPFLDEIWVFPDGSYEYCPNPERRFGDKGNAAAICENCEMNRIINKA